MKIKQTVQRLLVIGVLVTGLTSVSALFYQSSVQAACADIQTSVIPCQENDKNGNGKIDANEGGLWNLLILAINILIAGVGVLALAGIIWGSILYTSAGGNPEQVKKAMGVFTNVVIGVVAFAGMWVLLNFLIPGGAFNNL